MSVKKIEPGYREAQDQNISSASGILAPLLLRSQCAGKHPDRPHLAAPLLLL